MNENEVKKCPKCGGQMEIGYLDGAYNWNKGRNYYQLRHSPRIWGMLARIAAMWSSMWKRRNKP